ncbi:MAG TPA: hypothetical protein QF509_06825 [Rhodospirillales bacterium]|jgi:hypothetical protein|nr:hypothetical protein [Rhodospirillales bacterium]
MRRAVGFDDANQRRDIRRPMEAARLVVDGETCEIADFSLRGFLCMGYEQKCLHGDELFVGAIILADDTRVELNTQASVTRFSEERKYVAGVYVDVSTKTFSILEKLSLWRPVVPPKAGQEKTGKKSKKSKKR